ncbi:MAG: hypothetical protein H0U86_04545 [Chloroflexi bacterium]|nr:hypothetical protein [Chloroflexota bacterium]
MPSSILRPRDTWSDPAAYDAKARELAAMFAENFESYADGVSEAIRSAGPRADVRPARRRRRAVAEDAPSD